MPQIHEQENNLYELYLDTRKNLSEVTAAYWADLEVYRKLNEAQLYIVTKSRCLKKTVIVTTTNGTQEYDLKSTSVVSNDWNSYGFTSIIDIADDGVYFKIGGTTFTPLTFKTKRQLTKEFSGWQNTAAGTPAYYYFDKSTKIIGLYPKPNSTNAGAYLNITGYHTPKVLNAGTCASGTSSTKIVLVAGSATVPYPNPTNDYYNNLYIEIYSGVGAGEKVKITDYVGSTVTCTVALTATPTTASIYGMIPEIPAVAHYLMPLYALWKLWPKGGSRSILGRNYREEFITGLAEFIGEFIEDDDSEIIKDTYR